MSILTDQLPTLANAQNVCGSLCDPLAFQAVALRFLRIKYFIFYTSIDFFPNDFVFIGKFDFRIARCNIAVVDA